MDDDVKDETKGELTPAPPPADLQAPAWASPALKRGFVEALRRGDIHGVLTAFLGVGGEADAGHRRMAEYIVEVRRRNIAVLGQADVFVRLTDAGELQQVIAPVTLSLDDGSLYQIPDRWEKRLRADPSRLWEKGLGSYVSVPIVDRPEVANVSAEGFLRMNGIAGCSVRSPPTIIVDGARRSNPYVERNEDGDTTRIIIGVAVAGPSPVTGNVVVVDYVLDLDPRSDLLHMLANIMKGKWIPKNDTANRTEHDDDDDAETTGPKDAVFLVSRADFNEFRAELEPAKIRRRWSWLRLTGGIGLAHDLGHIEVKNAYDKYVGILENVFKKAQTVARRNAMKAHPALARHRVYMGGRWEGEGDDRRWIANRQAVVPVVGWTAAGGDIDQYARALDAVARGETQGIELIVAGDKYDAEKDRTGEADLDPVREETDETAGPKVLDETQLRNERLAALDEIVTSAVMTPMHVAGLGYPPKVGATLDELDAMLDRARELVATLSKKPNGKGR